jgi:hypothetical protein
MENPRGAFSLQLRLSLCLDYDCRRVSCEGENG